METIHVRLVSPRDLTPRAVGPLTDNRYLQPGRSPRTGAQPRGDAIECDILAGAANASGLLFVATLSGPRRRPEDYWSRQEPSADDSKLLPSSHEQSLPLASPFRLR
jgi:hypothetical protein